MVTNTNATRYDKKAQPSLKSMQQNCLAMSQWVQSLFLAIGSLQCSCDLQRRIGFLSPEIHLGGGTQAIN